MYLVIKEARGRNEIKTVTYNKDTAIETATILQTVLEGAGRYFVTEIQDTVIFDATDKETESVEEDSETLPPASTRYMGMFTKQPKK